MNEESFAKLIWTINILLGSILVFQATAKKDYWLLSMAIIILVAGIMVLWMKPISPATSS